MHYQVFFSIHAFIWFYKIPAIGATKFSPQAPGQLPRFPTSQLISSRSFYKLHIPRLQTSGIPSRHRKVANLVSLLNHLCNMSAFAALPQSATYVSQGFFYLNCILFQASLWTCYNKSPSDSPFSKPMETRPSECRWRKYKWYLSVLIPPERSILEGRVRAPGWIYI